MCVVGQSISVVHRAEWTYTLVVDYLDNSSELLSVDTSAEEDDTADLDESPLGGFDVRVAHFDCWILAEEKESD
jgi:hypothetical protein